MLIDWEMKKQDISILWTVGLLTSLHNIDV